MLFTVIRLGRVAIINFLIKVVVYHLSVCTILRQILEHNAVLCYICAFIIVIFVFVCNGNGLCLVIIRTIHIIAQSYLSVVMQSVYFVFIRVIGVLGILSRYRNTIHITIILPIESNGYISRIERVADRRRCIVILFGLHLGKSTKIICLRIINFSFNFEIHLLVCRITIRYGKCNGAVTL